MRKQNNNWLGWLFFIFVVFGAQLVPPIAQFLTRLTGQPISNGMVFGGLLGLYGLIVVVQGMIRGGAALQRGNESQLPTSMQPPSRTMQPPPVRNLPTSNSNPSPVRLSQPPPMSRNSGTPGAPRIQAPPSSLPPSGPPRFEPIVDPRILAFGIVGLLLFAGCFGLALLVSGMP